MSRKDDRTLNPRKGRIGNWEYCQWILPMTDGSGNSIAPSSYQGVGFTDVGLNPDWVGFYVMRAPHNFRVLKWGESTWRVYRNITHILTYTVREDGTAHATIQVPRSNGRKRSGAR